MPDLSTCRGCHRRIRFVRTEKSGGKKWMPLNPDPDPSGNVILVLGLAHELAAGESAPPGARVFKAHFATCPAAAAFRKDDLERARRRTFERESERAGREIRPDGRRPCALPTCGELVPYPHAFCGRHYWALSVDARERLKRARSAWHGARTTAAWDEAVREAVAALLARDSAPAAQEARR